MGVKFNSYMHIILSRLWCYSMLPKLYLSNRNPKQNSKRLICSQMRRFTLCSIDPELQPKKINEKFTLLCPKAQNGCLVDRGMNSMFMSQPDTKD